MMESDRQQKIRAAQIQLLYKQLPPALLATIVNATILVAVLWQEIPRQFLLGWLLVIISLSAGRYFYRQAYLRRVAARSELRGWRNYYLYGVLANGVLWGFASYFFFTTHSYIHQVFLAFVLAGMASGGITTLSSVRGAYLLFVAPALIPYGLRLLMAGGELHLAMALMLVVYLTMMGIIANRLYLVGTESLSLRFENLDLLRDLTQANNRQEHVNQELAAQIAEKRSAQEALQRAYADLEGRVKERTAELATSEEALRDADRRKNEFLAMLGHELRNPLAPIRNAVQILQKPALPDSTARWAHEVINRQVDRLTRLVDDLLEVSRIVYGKIRLRETLLEMAKVVNQAVEGSLPLIEGRRQNLSIDLPEKPLWVKGDPVRLEQVISNLLNNAAKYSEIGGRIYLRVEASEKWVTVSVRDNGSGISPEAMPHIFDLFAQADHTLARTQGGLGIGLTIVKRLVEMHGGRVEAHSEGTGRGSEFLVHLPSQAAKAEPAMPVHEQIQAKRSEGSMRVLVVDDNTDAVESLAFLLNLEGYTVSTACDGLSALTEAARFQPDVILLDIGMPGMDGYTVARELRARESTQSVIIVALTGYGQPEDRARAEAAGFTDHLTKPIDPQALNTMLKGYSARRA